MTSKRIKTKTFLQGKSTPGKAPRQITPGQRPPGFSPKTLSQTARPILNQGPVLF